jgi:transposase-like protein
MSLQRSDSRDDDLPAAKVGRRVTKALVRWARTVRLSLAGGRGAGVRAVYGQEQVEDDAARLYEEGWAVRQVARRFGYSDVVMRRILLRRTTLRRRPRRRKRPPAG